MPMLSELAYTRKGAWLAGSTLYVHPERFTADEMLGDARALKGCTAFGRTLKAGLTYSFDSPGPVPTTIAWGRRDLVLPYAQASIARKRLPSARHVTLPQCGHVPMVDDADLIVRVIEQTIAAAEPAEAA